MKYGELNLGQIEALVNKLGGMDAVKQILSETAKVVVEKVKEVLLQLVATVSVAARTTKFVVAKELSVGDHDGLKIAHWSDNFKELFGDRVEEPTAGSELIILRLTRYAYDTEIVADLGGDAKAGTTLSEFKVLLAKQGNGQKGNLLTNGYANIAYIRDVNNVLRVVCGHWDGGGWRLDAGSIDDPSRWNDDYQVVSRK